VHEIDNIRVIAGSKLRVTQVELVEKLVVANNAFRNNLYRETLLDTDFFVTIIGRRENFAESAMPDSIKRTVATGYQMPIVVRSLRIVFQFCCCHV